MSVDTKSLKTRIKSVDSTLHLTKAMGLVASAKIRGAALAMNKSREYLSALDNTVAMLSASKNLETRLAYERLSYFEFQPCVIESPIIRNLTEKLCRFAYEPSSSPTSPMLPILWLGK